MCQNRSLREGLALAPDYDYDLVSIGSGPAGQRAAVQAAKLGKRAAVIERGHLVGGVCLVTGTIPSKTFREAVLSFAARAHADGLTDTPTPPRPTAAELLGRVTSVMRRESAV